MSLTLPRAQRFGVVICSHLVVSLSLTLPRAEA
nr:MAG TPA: hypothetical protein [Caudoviricetes sp.]